MQRVYTVNDSIFECYMLQVVPKGQDSYSTGLSDSRLNIRCSHSLRKSKLNVKLYK